MLPASDANEHPGRFAFWALLESGGVSLLSLAVLLLVARRIGPAELGVFALAIGIVQLMTLAVEMLLHDALVQRRELDAAHGATAFRVTLGAGFVLGAATMVVAVPVARLYANPALAAVLAACALSLPLSGMGAVPVALARRAMRFRALALRSLWARLAGAAIALILVFGGAGIWSLVAQHLVQTAVSTALILRLWPPRLEGGFSSRRLRELLRFGGFAIGTELVWVATSRLLPLLTASFAGLAAAGFLNIGFRVVDTLYGLLAGAAHNLALPLFSRRQDDRDAVARGFRNATELAALVTLPIAAGLGVCAAPLLGVALGPMWLPAAPIVQVLALAISLQLVLLFAHAVITALGRPGLTLALAVFALGLVLAGFAAVRPESALEAAAIWSARVLVTAPILLAFVLRLLRMRLTLFLRAIAVPASATIAMTAVLILLDRYALQQVSAPSKLSLMVAAGVLLYAATLGAIGRSTLLRLAQLALEGVRQRRSPSVRPDRTITPE